MDYCPNCGERLTGAARFCAACGAATTADPDQTRLANEETRVAAPRPRAVEPRQAVPLASAAPPAERRIEDPNQAEQVIFTVRPTLLFVKIGYALAALGGVALIALLAWQPWLSIPFLVSLPLALALLLLPAYRHLKRNMLRYTLTDSKIEISEGFISQTTRNVLLRNVQDVTVTSTVWQRLLRFGNVVVDNAGAEGGVTVLRNIPDPRRHADILLRQLRRWR
jgi:membrane protein YdbS with pleckstrin-like domain